MVYCQSFKGGLTILGHEPLEIEELIRQQIYFRDIVAAKHGVLVTATD